MTNVAILALVSVVGGATALARSDDLSRYRDFQLGTDLATVAKQANVNPSEVRVIHSRPALIQELEWRPQQPGTPSKTESVRRVTFHFYNGELFRIVVYDQNETEGLTASDMIGAISAAYGEAGAPPPAKMFQGRYGEQEEVLAQWQDADFRFDLRRSSYALDYHLTGVLKKLEGPAQAASLEAVRLDDLEAPQRDAARIASEQEAARNRLEKARLVNKPNFRP